MAACGSDYYIPSFLLNRTSINEECKCISCNNLDDFWINECKKIREKMKEVYKDVLVIYESRRGCIEVEMMLRELGVDFGNSIWYKHINDNIETNTYINKYQVIVLEKVINNLLYSKEKHKIALAINLIKLKIK